MTKRRKLKELTIKDNFMFGAVMIDEALCKEFLELVLGFPIEKVTVDKEKSIIYHPEYKGIRLDITAADEKHTHYNIEMQVKKKKNLGKRSRYYHSQIDMELLRTGKDYGELPDSYVIFICDFDPFGRKKYRYTYETMCKEDKEAYLDEGRHTIFLSTQGENEEEVPEELVKFLRYVRSGLDGNTADFEDDFVKRLQGAVRKVKESRDMEERYMLFEELIKEEREEAKAEGKAEGKAEAILVLLSELGEIPGQIRKKILEEKDVSILDDYLKKAACAKAVEEFERLMEQE
ncbi:Rpn family recombination-promoting nuclease/putative transposase [Ruminococcus sp. 5_1_39BFAA]|uniref:Rpn family recombination-promoting nuclease/putative transposase n=1 Tax=Ruminococcus sp. 5_1_39BFAA TaxID=457412 RepID=UPI003567DAE3